MPWHHFQVRRRAVSRFVGGCSGSNRGCHPFTSAALPDFSFLSCCWPLNTVLCLEAHRGLAEAKGWEADAQWRPPSSGSQGTCPTCHTLDKLLFPSPTWKCYTWKLGPSIPKALTQPLSHAPSPKVEASNALAMIIAEASST